MEAAVCPSANDLFILAEKSCKLRAIYLWKAHGVNRAVRMVSNEVRPRILLDNIIRRSKSSEDYKRSKSRLCLKHTEIEIFFKNIFVAFL